VPDAVFEIPVASFCLNNGRVDEWERLATYVVNRRVDLGYRTRQAFADAIDGISLRTLGDVENGRRLGYGSNTLATLEHGLQWSPGSITKVLAGGEPTATSHGRNITDSARITDRVSAVTTRADDLTDDRDEAVRRVMLADDLTDDQKRRIARILIEEKRDAERRRVERAEQLIRLLGGED
jgi:hypothetical protein